MKKEKSSVSPPSQPAKAGLSISVVGSAVKEELAEPDIKSDIKQDPDCPGSQQNPAVNGENNCDTSGGPGSPGAGGGPGGPGDPAEAENAGTPTSLETDKKPGSGPPSNCQAGNGLIKSETDSFLDTFDTKDGGETQTTDSFIVF